MCEKRKLALLCDYGLDDAAATMYLINNASRFERIDILPIAGNFPLQVSMINAKRLLSNCETLPDNIRLVDTAYVTQNEESLPDIHGNDGMGDILPDDYSCDVKILEYLEWINDLDENYIVVSLGPCTVTLDILKRYGELPLLMMGGNIAEPPNYNGYEFNHGMDVDAFAQCIKYKHLIATLDSCHNHLCDFNHISFESNGLFEKVVKRSIELSNERKETGCYIYDLITVVYLLHPERFAIGEAQDKDGNLLTVLKYVSDEYIL